MKQLAGHKGNGCADSDMLSKKFIRRTDSEVKSSQKDSFNEEGRVQVKRVFYLTI